MTLRPFAVVLPLSLALTVAGVGPALSQARTDRAALVQKLADCRKIAEGTARLACYDAAAAALDEAEAKGDVVVVDREQANKVRRQAFGFTLPSLDIFDRPDRAKADGKDSGPVRETMDRITAQVERAYKRADGKWVLELEGGAVWVQTDNEPLGRGARKGSEAAIRKAAMGGYFINVDGQRAFRAQRTK